MERCEECEDQQVIDYAAGCYGEVTEEVDHLIFDKWVSLPGKAETVLLSAPFTFPPAPSIALSVFKSCLTEAGMRSSLKRFGRQRPADTGRSGAEGGRAASTLLFFYS